MKVGFVAILGKPNAGKSTLINALVGEKVSIVSWRPQTTRNKITGIVNGELNGEGYQLIFLDTPGINRQKDALSLYMSKAVDNASKNVEAIMYVIDGQKKISKEDFLNIESYKKQCKKLVVVLNKMDVADHEVFVSNLASLNPIADIEVVPTSAEKKDNLEPLLPILLSVMPEGEPLYPEDMYTDKPLRFMVAEIIREKALKFLQQEIPHGIGVDVVKYEVQDNGVTSIAADIVTDRENHKAIIIGKGGETLKRLATAARLEIEKLIDGQVYLKLWVKVKPDWKENVNVLNLLGYDKKDA
ncbi:MAG: GTPase Era [Clostridia bacterium]|nr:GTPase Era [Clostridia bacterium]